MDVYLFYIINNSFSVSDSAYGDVSGMPDPYSGHDISAELRNQDQYPIQAEEGVAPAPEGYSTPSRRVIREIIV